MSTPDQAARALLEVERFLAALGNGDWTLRDNITRTRDEARWLLKHYPLAPERYAARAWEDGWRSHKAGYLIDHNPHVTTHPEMGEL